MTFLTRNSSMIFVLMNPISYISCFLHSTIFNLHNIVRIINSKYMQWKSRAIYRDLMTEIVLTGSSKRPLISRGPFDWRTWRTPQMEQSTNQFQRGRAPLELSDTKYSSPQTLCRFSCTNYGIFASSLLEIFIFDERLPVLVSVSVHLQEIRKCIVRQVIVKIAITGHRLRSIRHIERGARLIC